MKRTSNCVVLAAIVAAVCIVGCGNEQSEPPKSGDALQTHLLDILKARYEATLAGDSAKARSHNLPYTNAANKVFLELIGKSWDEQPSKAGLDTMRSLPVLFSGAAPIEMKLAGNWAHLRQVGDDLASQAYFLLQDGKWWVVRAYFDDGKPVSDDKFAYLQADTYWPDHIADYFLLPQVRLDIKPATKPSTDPSSHGRLSLFVTNTSNKTISSTAMSRRFRSVQYIVGTRQNATELFGGEEFRDLKHGETFYVGDVTIRRPRTKGPIVFYVGPYVSNRFPIPQHN